MEKAITTSNEKSISSLIHLSTLCQYIIPFSNYVLPLLIWSSKKEDSVYINEQGKQAINFQLSLLLYSIVLLLIAFPTLLFSLFNIITSIETSGNQFTLNTFFASETITTAIIIGTLTIILLIALKITELFLIIYAATKTANGSDFKYPLTINFLK